MPSVYSSASQPAKATPFDNTSNLFVATDVQSAIEEILTILNTPLLDQSYFVSKQGNDTTGNGSLAKPYLTIAKAYSVITDSSPTKRYTIFVGPGDYNENLTVKANVFVKGAGALATRITGTAQSINDTTWNVASTDNRSGFMDITLNGTGTWDFTAQANNTEGKLYFFNIRTNNTWTFTALNAINQVVVRDTDFFGAWVQNGMNAFISNSTWQSGSLTLNSSAAAGIGTTLTLVNGRITGNITASWTSNQGVTLNLAGVSVGAATTLTATGSSCTVNATVDSLPVPALRTVSGGAVINRINVPDLGIFGDGSDGDVSLSSGTTTLTRTMYYNNLTLSSTAVVNTAGYRIYVRNTLTISGTAAISNDGGAGGNASGNTPGSAGTSAAGVEVGPSQAGIAGVTQMNNGSSPGAIIGYGNNGGAGGNGGQNGGGTSGGTGAAGGTVTHLPERILRHEHWQSATAFKQGGAAGGVGGGGQPSLLATAGASGGSGAGGGVVIIFAARINSTSSVGITARGGKGGNGGNAASGNSGGGAGSGGGGGGQIYLIVITVTALGTLNVSGGAIGTGGTQNGTGAVGANGVAGSTGRTTVYNMITDTWTVT